MFDISTYNQKRTKEEFFKWVGEWAVGVTTLEGMKKLIRRDRDTKIMFEEAQGIARYVSSFYRDSDVFIELRDGSQNFDAIIYGAESNVIEYVEITTVPQVNDHKLQHEFADTGRYSLVTQLTHRRSYLAYADRVTEAIRKKQAKSYPTPTTLLVTLSPDMIVEEDETFDFVIKHLDAGLTAGAFVRILVFDLPGTHWHAI